LKTSGSVLYISSEQKTLKEKLMDANITDRLEDQFSYLNGGLTIPKRTKTMVKV